MSSGSSAQNSETVIARLVSIDAYRGMVMFLMLAEMLHLYSLADIEFTSGIGQWIDSLGIFDWIRFHTTHVEWEGCSLHDMIQPSFSFLVGAAVPFSIASRITKGQSTGKMVWHAAWRSLVLVLLGVFLRSLGDHRHQTYFTFEDTLSQIGLGYFFLFLIGLGPKWLSWLSVVLILVGYWAAFALYPLPSADFDYSAVGVRADWPHHKEGFQSHWNINSNLAWAFDRWFLNLFPRESEFLFNGGGYSTLSFIPTLGTMLLGLIAGNWLRSDIGARNRWIRMASAAVLCMALGWGISNAGYCPSVKKIWTPTWTLWSGGICFAILLAFYSICDLAGWKSWTFPWVVIGANSIAAYVMDWTMKDWIQENLLKHFGQSIFQIAGAEVEPFLLGLTTLAILWMILFWMYRQRIFIKI